jgi:hypothetical protein
MFWVKFEVCIAQNIYRKKKDRIEEMEEALHIYAKSLIDKGEIDKAWQAFFVSLMKLD